MNKLRLLETTDVYLPDVDGVINCMHNYCLNLNDKTELLTLVPKNKKGYVDNLPYNIIRCKSIHVPILNQYYGLLKFDYKIKKELEKKQFDIIHVHSPFGMSKYALKYAKKHNIPAVATFHSNMRPIFQDVVKSKWIAEKMVRSLGRRYNKFDEIFVCSPLVAEQARSFGYKGKISYLPFGTDLKKCEDIENLSKIANSKFNILEKEFVFIYVGRLTKLKRIDFILRSLKIVKENKINFKFFIVGKGFEMEKLKALTQKLELNENVFFTGFLSREDFPSILARADLLLFPSIYDNFGLVKVEAAAYETPGLFIKNSCAGYDVKDGINGYLSDNDENSFADKIIEATTDYDHLKKIGKNASNDLYISWEECSNILLERLNEIVREKKNENKK